MPSKALLRRISIVKDGECQVEGRGAYISMACLGNYMEIFHLRPYRLLIVGFFFFLSPAFLLALLPM